MKRRGETYRQWCDPILHHQIHEETLDTGACLEVQARLSRITMIIVRYRLCLSVSPREY